MALALFTFLGLITFFAVARASPLTRRTTNLNRDLIDIQNAAIFQTNIEAITGIYRGNKVQENDLNHLIIVTGHAILLDTLNYMNDEAWVLEEFQKGGQVQSFVDHIMEGVEIAKNDEKSLLVFSGYAFTVWD